MRGVPPRHLEVRVWGLCVYSVYLPRGPVQLGGGGQCGSDVLGVPLECPLATGKHSLNPVPVPRRHLRGDARAEPTVRAKELLFIAFGGVSLLYAR